MARKALFALSMGSMATVDFPQAVPQQQLVDARGKQRRRNVDEDGDGCVFGESALAEEDGGYDSSA